MAQIDLTQLLSFEDIFYAEDEVSDLSEDSVSDSDVADGTEAGVTLSDPGFTDLLETNAQILELLQEIHATQTEILVSSQRIEKQNEASISILLIFLVVGMLKIIYKFFKWFF